jgi:tetratricopeptide (TPR) repeat protein
MSVPALAEVRHVFCEAIERKTLQDQAEYLDQACQGRPELRSRVEALLRANAEASSFLQERGSPDATVTQSIREGPGAVIGPYKLLEQIGEGGFGLVFMAEQQQPVRRKVAVKVLKPGMDTRQVIARFEAERQALALMDHPNIARVLEAGTIPLVRSQESGADKQRTGEVSLTPDPCLPTPGSGRPYFVMELVRGVSITDYCDQHRLTTRQRLELFVPVCQAVQHAHLKGIIHRDIKPSNVLVTLQDSVPVVKVIDFGIAKALGQQLTDKTLFTGFAQLVGTPLYMSPEQAELSGLDIDTRSDIYSLGVLLYELLTGMTPFDKERLREASYDEIRRIIREEEPSKPSTRVSTLGQAAATVSERRQSDPKRLSQLFRGELDWIVMKALEKDRNRRYETASAFAADVERYLNDEPVAACPPSAWYRLRKFARRERRSLTMAAVVTAALLLVGVSLAWVLLDRAAWEAEAAGDVAARQAETARQVHEAVATAQTLLDRNGPALARQKLAEAKGLMGKDSAALAELAGQIDVFDSELDRLQQFLHLIDQARQVETVNATWQPAKAVPFLREALARYEIMDREDWCGRLEQNVLGKEQVEQIRRCAYEELIWLAVDVVNRRKDHSSGQPLSPKSAAQQALAYLGKAEMAHWPIHSFYALRARCHEELGEATAARADQELADKTPPTTVLDHELRGLAAYKERSRAEGVKAFEAALRLDPTRFRSLMFLGACLCDLGRGSEDFAAAAMTFTGCIMKRPEYAHAYQNRANAYTRLHRWDEAEKDNTRAIELDPKHVGAWISRGGGYLERKQWDKAVADYSTAIKLDPNNALPWYRRGEAYAGLGQLPAALANYTKAIELDRTKAPAWHYRAIAYTKLGQRQKAIDDYSKAIELDPKLAEAWSNRGGLYADLGRLKEALEDIDKAIAADANFAPAYLNRGQVHRKLRQWNKAIDDYSECIELDAEFVPAWNNRAYVYGALGQWPKAVDDYTKLTELTPKDWEVWNNRGRGYYRLKQWDNALADFTEAIKLNPKNPLPWSNRGSLRAERGRLSEALADFSEAITADSKYVMAWFHRGTMHFVQKQWDKAITDYSRAIHLAPKFVPALSNRAAAYTKVDQWDKAVADLGQCIELEPKNAARHNELAWLLATLPDTKVRDPRRAVHLARNAVKLLSKQGAYWNTLGVALYRTDDWKGALEALGKSTQLQGENAVDSFFQAMAHRRMGDKQRARGCYEQAVRLMAKSQAGNEELRRFRAEAAHVLGLEQKEK